MSTYAYQLDSRGLSEAIVVNATLALRNITVPLLRPSLLELGAVGELRIVPDRVYELLLYANLTQGSSLEKQPLANTSFHTFMAGYMPRNLGRKLSSL